jgi:glycine hydroxymethyltransferase
MSWSKLQLIELEIGAELCQCNISLANTAVFFACLKPGDKILGFDLSHGGHLTHGFSCNFSGRFTYPFLRCRETGRLDYDKNQELHKEQK